MLFKAFARVGARFRECSVFVSQSLGKADAPVTSVKPYVSPLPVERFDRNGRQLQAGDMVLFIRKAYRHAGLVDYNGHIIHVAELGTPELVEDDHEQDSSSNSSGSVCPASEEEEKQAPARQAHADVLLDRPGEQTLPMRDDELATPRCDNGWTGRIKAVVASLVAMVMPVNLFDKKASGNVRVLRSRFDDVLKSSEFEIYTPTTTHVGVTELAPDETIARAESMMGRAVEYNLVLRNCQHFVSWCKYDRCISQDVEFVCCVLGSALGAAHMVSAGPFALATGMIVGGALGVHLCGALFRYVYVPFDLASLGLPHSHVHVHSHAHAHVHAHAK